MRVGYNEVIIKYGIDLNLFEDVKKIIFNEPLLFNYFKVVKYICKKNNVSLNVVDELENIINNGDKYDRNKKCNRIRI